ncbi:DUF2235 domain-containing protein [Pelagibius marinus]|uniref:DUF2235 domain-containing protein n=1 Tax=Pelagibius marinus TaxID=2762760 RepID=UPI0018730837|nr:DUF2235 domain-containing protein [Pelagibius marinus]
MSDFAAAGLESSPLLAPNKKIVICMDGTWNEPEEESSNSKFKQEPTNVLKVVRGVKQRDSRGTAQITYYHTGVGTDAGFYDRFIGGAVGAGISNDIQDAYRFIANNYQSGDRLYIFGFSRGAFSARSLAGFIGSIGLMDKKHLAWLPEAYRLYRTEKNKRQTSEEQRVLDDLGIKCVKSIPIHFLGVWDTVGALGVPTPMLQRLSRKWVSFHDTGLGKDVKHAYHALAIDERRRPFKPDLWTSMGDKDHVVEQVWFAGVHSNIGGGYRNRTLSDISLKWMADRAEECGLEFKEHLHTLEPREISSGKVEPSYSLAYKALRALNVLPYDREIGDKQIGDEKKKTGVNESVHWTAVEALDRQLPIDFRKSEAQPYASANLARARGDKLPIWVKGRRGRIWNYEAEDAASSVA